MAFSVSESGGAGARSYVAPIPTLNIQYAPLSYPRFQDGLEHATRVQHLGQMNWSRGTWVFATLLSGYALAGTTTQAASSVVVIVHLSNPAQDLSNNQLRDLLLGRMNQWPDRRNVTLVQREPGSLVLNTVLRKCLNTTLQEYVHQLLALEFRGKTAPVVKTLRSDDGACSFVFNVPGAIGFISDRSLSLPSCHDQVKALQISGKDFASPGYPLSMER